MQNAIKIHIFNKQSVYNKIRKKLSFKKMNIKRISPEIQIILDSISDGLFTVDRDFKITFFLIVHRLKAEGTVEENIMTLYNNSNILHGITGLSGRDNDSAVLSPVILPFNLFISIYNLFLKILTIILTFFHGLKCSFTKYTLRKQHIK